MHSVAIRDSLGGASDCVCACGYRISLGGLGGGVFLSFLVFVFFRTMISYQKNGCVAVYLTVRVWYYTSH
jgi:hypothetical protein